MRLIAAFAVLVLAAQSRADEPIRLLQEFTLSPKGDVIYFAWRGDIWSHPTTGGSATRLTAHPAGERFPRVSPDGKSLAFVSDRTGVLQVYRMPVGGGEPEQITTHSEGSVCSGWLPDGSGLLVRGNRDHFWQRAGRYFLKKFDDTNPKMLFDSECSSGTLSPDGKKLLFAREGVIWWRKAYTGSQASQIWGFDLETRKFERFTTGDVEERWPLWMADGSGYYFVTEKGGVRNLAFRTFGNGNTVLLTKYKDDGVLFPTVAAHGRWIAYRAGFDTYLVEPGGEPRKLDLIYRGDRIHERVRRMTLSAATQVAYSDDAREIAFIANGDLWVMDTELKEPRQITNTPEEERDPSFAPDHKSILFVSESGGQCDIWSATRADKKKHWWQNDKFVLKQLTHDSAPEFNPQYVAGNRIAFTARLGDLYTMDPDGSAAKIILESWNQPSWDFSPDGKWVAYAVDDDDFNRDIWIRAADGSGEPVNVSRHPDWESNPVFSPDGKKLAFVGARNHDEVDIHYVFLRKADDEESRRERTIEKAVKKMKGRKSKKKSGAAKKKKPAQKPEQKTVMQRMLERWKKAQDAQKKADSKDDPRKKKPQKKKQKKKPEKSSIDFDGIEDRIRRISIPKVRETGLMWSPDSKRLAFRAKIDGKTAIWTVSPPDEIKPKSLSTANGGGWRWIKEGDQIVGLVSGRPTALSKGGKPTTHAFRIRTELDLPARHRAAFDLCWRTMGGRWYDEKLNNRNWRAVGEKYRTMAGECVNLAELSQVVNMMLGELNGSHLGFRAREASTFRPPAWREETPHFGARFDADHAGKGLRVASVIEGTPCWRGKSRLEPGDVILSADGVDLDPAKSYESQLNGPPNRDIVLKVRNAAGKERTFSIRPTSFGAVRRLLYDDWVKKNRAAVEKASDGKLGYLHIRGMNWPSFEKFEAELYKVAAGRDGLIIDVRNNGGGFTADHLLTALCQPVHAITVPRGGHRGYPQDRIVYARWTKPITVLCNQNSFSNAEIFAHAVKNLKRGKVVGVRTAGGVISTGGVRIMGFGFLRMPFRAWFVAATGEDMELNGCKPDFEIWPEPEEWTRGTDRQLEKAIAVLTDEVAKAPRKKPLRYKAGSVVEPE